MYGHEDRLLNTVATHPIIFRLNHGDTLIKPAHVLDVAEAMQRMMDAESTIGQTFSLQGPKMDGLSYYSAMGECLVANYLARRGYTSVYGR
jgi:NADH dehydrogenase (ubiquinone) 1 alpha subcomplex subunit 9